MLTTVFVMMRGFAVVWRGVLGCALEVAVGAPRVLRERIKALRLHPATVMRLLAVRFARRLGKAGTGQLEVISVHGAGSVCAARHA